MYFHSNMCIFQDGGRLSDARVTSQLGVCPVGGTPGRDRPVRRPFGTGHRRDGTTRHTPIISPCKNVCNTPVAIFVCAKSTLCVVPALQAQTESFIAINRPVSLAPECYSVLVERLKRSHNVLNNHAVPSRTVP